MFHYFWRRPLVSLGGKHAILTAAHVASEFAELDDVGLCLDAHAHRFAVPRSHLDTVYVGWSGAIKEIGPDLAVVRLPDTCVETLRAQKSFYELSHMIECGNVRPVDYTSGIFFAGCIGEWTEDGPGEAGFDATKRFGRLCGGVGRIDKYWKHGDFDFCRFTVQCHRDNPQNYQGASGGGLWKVIATSADPRNNQVKDAILCGVAYWQTELTDGRRGIVCHAHKSIYRNAFNAMT